MDMRHVLFVGFRFGVTVGAVGEFGQWLLRRTSGMDPQDFYSNRIGRNLQRAYGYYIRTRPKMLSNYIDSFFEEESAYNH